MLDKYLKICEKAVRSGGDAIQQWIGKIEVSKKGPADLVTQADFASQEAIARTVLTAFPDHLLVGEESQSSSSGQVNSPYRWIADPLDGTTNFVHGIPHYAVSLALEHQGELLVGAVWDPILQECFTAVRGRGAWRNEEPIHTSRVTQISEALGVVGFPPRIERDAPDFLVFIEAVLRCQSVHRSGSTALNLSYLAAGRYDVCWSFSVHPWDVAAGVLLIREAGGVISCPRGEAFSLEHDQFLSAANPALHSQFQNLVLHALQKEKCP
jgi:myo-inositol-1(or 4)-monophosphatase